MRIKFFALTWLSILIFTFFSFSALAYMPFCEGDFNGDKDVDGVDFVKFTAEFNMNDCNGDCPGDFDKDGTLDPDDLKLFSADFGQTECATIAYKLHGLNFSPYMDGQDPNLGSVISEDQIRQRIQIIAPYTEWIRSFGSTHGLEHTGRIAHEFDLKAAAGAWLGTDSAANALEMQNLIDAARSGHVDLAVVGSEVLLRGDLSAAQLIDYINQFKSEVPGIPVTTADVYSVLLDHPDVMAACDVIFVNYYPYWEGIDVNYAVAYVHALHQEMIAKAGGKEVIVSESGWPSDGNQIGDAIPTLGNACFYNLNFVSWARAENVTYFLFEAFDETWKANYEGPQGAHWGLWDKHGNLKPCMQDIFDGLTVPDNWTCQEIPGGPGIPEIQFVYVPPYGSYENLRGQVWHVQPAEYKVAVYIRVGSGWWTKPLWNAPLTQINCDGTWTCDITTGGNDHLANTIAAYLVPNGYDPPSAGGESTLPPELMENSVANFEVTRTP
jgi:exo-beta-1,3-glucanase (GH17 family)